MVGAEFIGQIKTPDPFSRLALPARGFLNKDPIVWLYGTRTSPKSTRNFFRVKLRFS